MSVPKVPDGSVRGLVRHVKPEIDAPKPVSPIDAAFAKLSEASDAFRSVADLAAADGNEQLAHHAGHISDGIAGSLEHMRRDLLRQDGRE